MPHRKLIYACILLTTLALPAAAQTADDPSAETADFDTEALDIITRMADYLVATETFAYRVEYGFDVVQASGIKVEFGASRRLLVSRPDRLRMEFQRRDGLRGIVVFDGEHIWAHAPDENVYAKTEQVGGLDESVNFVVSELRIKAPMSDLVSPDLHAILKAELTRAYYLGETVLAGVDCQHVLLSNDYADFQMWIRSGDQPLPQRVVITYREEIGQPQFRAQFLEWDLSPADSDAKTRFEPPGDAERVRFYIPARGDYQDAEDAS